MEYVLALTTLLFGFIAGRKFTLATKSDTLDKSLFYAINRGHRVIIVIGDVAVETKLINGKYISRRFTYNGDENE